MSANHEILLQIAATLKTVDLEVAKGIEGKRLPRNVAFALVGWGAYMQAMGKQILENIDKEKV